MTDLPDAGEKIDVEASIMSFDSIWASIESGTWTAKAGTSYFTVNIGQEYKGVMVEQTLEPKNDKAPCFTALDNKTGVTVWGYRYAEN